MGKSNQGIHGNWYGKVGNIVGRVRQNRTILSIYQPSVTNPRTDSQKLVRNKFTMLTKIMSSMAGVLKVSFADLDGYKTGNYYSAAVGFNAKNNPFTGSTYSDVNLDMTKLAVSQGSIDLPFSPSATGDSENITATWSDNSGLGNAQASDKIAVVLVNKVKNQSVWDMSTASRSTRTVTVTAPTSWSGDQISAYLFAIREGVGAGKSVHLGSFTI